MIESVNKTYITTMAAAATMAGHIFPQMAAAEAALESGFGSSELAKLYLNEFGTKQHQHPEYGTVNLPTKEYDKVKGWYVTNAAWVVYPDLTACFQDRMATLVRLRGVYPHYNNALNATDPITYVQEVSLTWSTGPARAAEAIKIYQQYFGGKS